MKTTSYPGDACPHLAALATGPATATYTNPPHPIHHRLAGYQIDRYKLKKISKAFTPEVKKIQHRPFSRK